MTSSHRELFSLPPDLHYLNCAFMGPLPRTTEAAGIRGIRRKRNPEGVQPDHFFDESDRTRECFARLLGTPEPERIALLPSVSYGIAIAARNAGLVSGQEILLTRDQFPGNVYGWMRAADEAGARVRLVDPPASVPRGRDWNRRILESIGPRTRVVSMGHVHWTDGTLFRLEHIGARAREVGALLVLDATQSLGALPLDFAAVRPDAVICAAYKWLLGPYSVALGYFGPAFDDGVPLEETWIARRGSRDFGGLVRYQDAYEPGMVRFDVGERSNFILLPMVLASLELLLEWGPRLVQEHTRGISRGFLDWTVDKGIGVEEEGWRADHLFGLRLPERTDREKLAAAMAEERVSASLRGDALRISPHLYNDEEDLEALRSALERGLGLDG